MGNFWVRTPQELALHFAPSESASLASLQSSGLPSIDCFPKYPSLPRQSKATVLSTQQPGCLIPPSSMLPNFQNKCPTSAASSSHLLHSGNPPQSGHRPQGSMEEMRVPGSPTQCLPFPQPWQHPLGLICLACLTLWGLT